MNVLTSSCKVPDLFVQFEPDLDFLDRKSPYQIWRKSGLWEAELMHAGSRTGRTDVTKLIGAFHFCANTPTRHGNCMIFGLTFRLRLQACNLLRCTHRSRA